MKQNKGEFDTFAAPFFVKIFIKFEGRKADFRMTDRSPVFEMSCLETGSPPSTSS